MWCLQEPHVSLVYCWLYWEFMVDRGGEWIHHSQSRFKETLGQGLSKDENEKLIPVTLQS